MKEKELRSHATCSLCEQPIGKTGLPMFWTAKVERHALDLGAIQRQDGLAMSLGNRAGLAEVFSRGEEMTKTLMEEKVITICEDCAMKDGIILACFDD
jgi:hypothetical protein